MCAALVVSVQATCSLLCHIIINLLIYSELTCCLIFPQVETEIISSHYIAGIAKLTPFVFPLWAYIASALIGLLILLVLLLILKKVFKEKKRRTSASGNKQRQTCVKSSINCDDCISSNTNSDGGVNYNFVSRKRRFYSFHFACIVAETRNSGVFVCFNVLTNVAKVQGSNYLGLLKYSNCYLFLRIFVKI